MHSTPPLLLLPQRSLPLLPRSPPRSPLPTTVLPGRNVFLSLSYTVFTQFPSPSTYSNIPHTLGPADPLREEVGELWVGNKRHHWGTGSLAVSLNWRRFLISRKCDSMLIHCAFNKLKNNNWAFTKQLFKVSILLLGHIFALCCFCSRPIEAVMMWGWQDVVQDSFLSTLREKHL